MHLCNEIVQGCCIRTSGFSILNCHPQIFATFLYLAFSKERGPQPNAGFACRLLFAVAGTVRNLMKPRQIFILLAGLLIVVGYGKLNLWMKISGPVEGLH